MVNVGTDFANSAVLRATTQGEQRNCDYTSSMDCGPLVLKGSNTQGSNRISTSSYKGVVLADHCRCIVPQSATRRLPSIPMDIIPNRSNESSFSIARLV